MFGRYAGWAASAALQYIATTIGTLRPSSSLSRPRASVSLMPAAHWFTVLEALIAHFEGRGRAILLLGGHLGLRPKEIRLVPWCNFDGESLIVGRARTKRGAARTRVIAVPRITARELKDWRLASGGRGEEPIVGPLGEAGLRLWAWQHLGPAAKKLAGLDDVTT